MKTLSITPPDLPENITISLIEWFINDEPDFTKMKVVGYNGSTPIYDLDVLWKKETNGNTFVVDVPIVITNDIGYYAFVKVSLSDGTIVNSDIVSFTKNNTAFYLSDFIYPAIVDIRRNTDGSMLDIFVEEPKFFFDSKEQYATSYRITDISGNIIIDRMFDTDNFSYFSIPISKFKGNDVIIVNVRQEFKGLRHDNWSRTFYKLKPDTTDIYLVNNSVFDFKTTILEFVYDENKYDTINIEIESLTNNTLLTANSIVGKFYSLSHNVVDGYEKVKIKMFTSESTEPSLKREKIVRVLGNEYINI